jgi:hypothetical protein
MCRRHYGRWVYRQRKAHGPLRAPRPDDKVAYLASLTEGELAAYCAGVLSRASIVPGDPEEIAGWMELVRLTARR